MLEANIVYQLYFIKKFCLNLRGSTNFKMNLKKSTLWYIMIKLSKTKDREFWKQEEWIITDKGPQEHPSPAYFLSETLEPGDSDQ